MPAPKRPLRAVKPGDVKPAPKTITQAASSGTPRELLVALRARVAKAVESEATPPRDLAALTKRLVDIDREIRALDSAESEEHEQASAADEAFDASAF